MKEVKRKRRNFPSTTTEDGAVSVPYPSIICGGISFLVLVWLFIFRREEFIQEVQKKFRI